MLRSFLAWAGIGAVAYYFLTRRRDEGIPGEPTPFHRGAATLPAEGALAAFGLEREYEQYLEELREPRYYSPPLTPEGQVTPFTAAQIGARAREYAEQGYDDSVAWALARADFGS